MDIRYFGDNLLALDKSGPNRRRSWTAAQEDIYYSQHAPTERQIPRITSVAVAVCLGLVTVGLWLR
jgi:hypothetical protein